MNIEKLGDRKDIAHIPIEAALAFVDAKNGFSHYKSQPLRFYDSSQAIAHAPLECIVRDSRAQLFLNHVSVGTFDLQHDNTIPFTYETALFPEPNFTLLRLADQRLSDRVLYAIVQKDSSVQTNAAMLDNHAIAAILGITLRSASTRIERVKSNFAVHRTKSKRGTKHVLLVPPEDAAKLHRDLTADHLMPYVQTLELLEAEKVKAEARQHHAHSVVLNGEEYYVKKDVQSDSITLLTYACTSIDDHFVVRAACVDAVFLAQKLGMQSSSAARRIINAAMERFSHYKSRPLSGGSMKTVLLVQSENAALVHQRLSVAPDEEIEIILYHEDDYDRKKITVNNTTYYMSLKAGSSVDEENSREIADSKGYSKGSPSVHSKKVKKRTHVNKVADTDQRSPYDFKTFTEIYRNHRRTANEYASSVAHESADELADTAFLLLAEQWQQNDEDNNLDARIRKCIDFCNAERKSVQFNFKELSYLTREERNLLVSRYHNQMTFMDMYCEYRKSIVELLFSLAAVRAKIKQNNPDHIAELNY